ncbi:integrase, partial [Rhizobiaceae sp. 2RAB30]
MHPRSPYHNLKPGSLRPYKHYLRQLKGHIGPVRIDDISGVDLLDWHDVWSDNGKHLAAASMARAVLAAGTSFGVMLRSPGCAELAAIIKEIGKKVRGPRSRTATTTAENVVALRQAAHAAGRPSSALAYAVAFEST